MSKLYALAILFLSFFSIVNSAQAETCRNLMSSNSELGVNQYSNQGKFEKLTIDSRLIVHTPIGYIMPLAVEGVFPINGKPVSISMNFNFEYDANSMVENVRREKAGMELPNISSLQLSLATPAMITGSSDPKIEGWTYLSPLNGAKFPKKGGQPFTMEFSTDDLSSRKIKAKLQFELQEVDGYQVWAPTSGEFEAQ